MLICLSLFKLTDALISAAEAGDFVGKLCREEVLVWGSEPEDALGLYLSLFVVQASLDNPGGPEPSRNSQPFLWLWAWTWDYMGMGAEPVFQQPLPIMDS